MHADELETITHSYCGLSKCARLTSDSTIFGYDAKSKLSERLLQRERAFSFHSEDRLLEGKSNVKRDMRIFGNRGDPALKANHSRPRSPFFFPTALNSEQWIGHGGKESHTQVRVSFLPITEVTNQRYTQITIIGVLFS